MYEVPRFVRSCVARRRGVHSSVAVAGGVFAAAGRGEVGGAGAVRAAQSDTSYTQSVASSQPARVSLLIVHSFVFVVETNQRDSLVSCDRRRRAASRCLRVSRVCAQNELESGFHVYRAL